MLHSEIASNPFALGITGVTSWTYRLEYATNLKSANWSLFTNITLSPANLLYQQPAESTSTRLQFHRLIPTME